MNYLKLKESLDKLKGLLDERQLFGRAKDHKTLLIFSSKNAPPSHIFISLDGKELSESDKIGYYKFNAKGYKKVGRDIPYGRQQEFIELITDLRYMNRQGYENNKQILATAMRDSNIRQLMKFTELNRQKLFKVLSTDLKIDLGTISEYFGSFDNAGATDFEYKGALIDFPTGASDKNKKIMMDIIKEMDSLFKKYGISKVLKGQIRFVKLTGKTLGYYDIYNKDMKISYNAKRSKRLTHTLAHEFGHKWFYEFINNKISDIRKKYNELSVSKEHSFDNSKVMDKYEDLTNDFLSKAQVGDVLKYIGRKRKFKGDWVIVKISNGVVYLEDSEKVSGLPKSELGADWRFSAKPTAFIGSNEWSSDDKEIAEILSHREIPPQESEEVFEEWFPTQYSTKNASEWYAELFAFAMLGKLSGEPMDFIKDTLK